MKVSIFLMVFSFLTNLSLVKAEEGGPTLQNVDPVLDVRDIDTNTDGVPPVMPSPAQISELLQQCQCHCHTREDSKNSNRSVSETEEKLERGSKEKKTLKGGASPEGVVGCLLASRLLYHAGTFAGEALTWMELDHMDTLRAGASNSSGAHKCIIASKVGTGLKMGIRGLVTLTELFTLCGGKGLCFSGQEESIISKLNFLQQIPLWVALDNYRGNDLTVEGTDYNESLERAAIISGATWGAGIVWSIGEWCSTVCGLACLK